MWRTVTLLHWWATFYCSSKPAGPLIGAQTDPSNWDKEDGGGQLLSAWSRAQGNVPRSRVAEITSRLLHHRLAARGKSEAKLQRALGYLHASKKGADRKEAMWSMQNRNSSPTNLENKQSGTNLPTIWIETCELWTCDRKLSSWHITVKILNL
jgi:hypothetical protein